MIWFFECIIYCIVLCYLFVYVEIREYRFFVYNIRA